MTDLLSTEVFPALDPVTDGAFISWDELAMSAIGIFDLFEVLTVAPPAPLPPPAVIPFTTYGQIFAADGNAVAGARDLAIDLNTGLFKRTVSGGIALTQGVDSIRQAIELEIGLLFGEWFLDNTIGFPLFERVLVKSPNIPAIRDLFRTRIEAVAGVLSVLKLDLAYDRAARKATVTFAANTDLGEISGTLTR